MEGSKRFWDAFKNIAIVFSFTVNFILVILVGLLIVAGVPTVFTLKTGLVEPLLNDLDAAFVGLGESTIDTTVQIDKSIPIQFSLPLSETMPINFQLSIEQDTAVVLNAPVPLNMPAQFNLPGGGGVINGTVSLALPAGLRLPVRLGMVVPVSQTIPVRMDVPVNQTIPIQMDVPVRIKLGEAGLDSAVEDLRGVFRPLKERIESLPDGIGLP